ncbi:MAG: DUF2520 domain-containing protein [Prevotella sp.]|nr:DUF2520 domain-containing protein [Prevotella sp.]
MKIALIGAGNLATNLGIALLHAGHNILQVYSRTKESARTLANELGCIPVTYIHDVCDDADIYIIAVKDSAIADIIPDLCNSNRKNKIFVHTAGSIPMSVFQGYAKHYGVLYPMQTFSKARIVDFQDIPCFIEGNNETALTKIITLASTVSKDLYNLTSEARQYLHLSAVFACNFVNHCYAIASDILTKQNIPFKVMLPLIDETARKVHALPPQQAQTGPAVRYDINVITSQSELLKDNPVLYKLYKLMSSDIHQLAINKKYNDQLRFEKDKSHHL